MDKLVHLELTVSAVPKSVELKAENFSQKNLKLKEKASFQEKTKHERKIPFSEKETLNKRKFPDYSQKVLLLEFEELEYTDEALEEGLEGMFSIKVLVSKEGKVLQAFLLQEIGFEMDERVLEASRRALFSPARNSLGRPIQAWGLVTLQLEI